MAAIGERLAAENLESQGFSIIARNFRLRLGEIDLIGWEGETLVFVEVKCRKSRRFGYGGEAITLQKQRKIIQTAQAFLSRFPQLPPCRFDAVIVDLSGTDPLIEHLKDAFRT